MTTRSTNPAATTIEIMDASWSCSFLRGEALVLSVNLTEGDRTTALTVRATREWDYDEYTVKLACERVLGVEIDDVEQVLANHFVGVELEAQVLSHAGELSAYVLESFARWDEVAW